MTYPKTRSPKVVSIAFTCPCCKAWPGVPCKSPSGKRASFHVDRVQLLADDEKRQEQQRAANRRAA
jgi:hypothetical protein